MASLYLLEDATYFALQTSSTGYTTASLTGIEPVWFEMENNLPYCVEKA